MDDARLNDRLREHRGDRLGEALEAIDDGKQDIFRAPVAKLIHHPQPEFGTLILLKPQAEHLFAAIGADTQRNVDRLIADHALVADLDPDRVEENERVDRIERPLLPGGHFVEHRIGHRADQVGRDVDAIQFVQMSDDLPGAHAARVHRHDLVIEPGKAALILGDQLRIEARLAITRHVDRQLAGVGHHGLAAIAVTRVAGAVLASEVMIHLRVQGALGQRLLQRIEQTSLLKRRAGGSPCQKPIEKIVRYRRLFASGHTGNPFYPLCQPTHGNPDSPR